MTNGIITKVAGPLVIAEGMRDANMFDVVRVSSHRLIGEIIFNHPDEREWINSVAHPILLNYARQFLVDCCEAGARLVVLEVPLLFEAGWEHLFDEIWVVYTLKKF